MASVRLAWDANVESDLAGYAIEYGTASGVYDTILDVGNVTTWLVVDLTAGTTYYFAIKAYNAGGLFSPVSDEVSAVALADGVSISVPTISGTGTVFDGGIRITVPSLQGTGTETFTGTGSITLAVQLMSTVTGEGAVTFSAPSLNGTGAVTVSDISEGSIGGGVTTKALKVWPPAAAAVTVTQGPTNDTYGDWVQIVASAAAKSQIAGFMVGLYQSDSTGGGHLDLQLGVGADGAELPIGDFLIVSKTAVNTTLETFMLRVPVDLVPAGSRVSARLRMGVAAGQRVDLAVMYYEGLDATVSTTGYYHYLPDGSDPGDAASITPSAGAWANSTGWVELGRPADPSGLIGVGVMSGSSQDFEDYEIDLAIGEPAAEVLITTLRSNFGNHGYQDTWLPGIYPVDADTRVSCRFRKSGTSTSMVRARLLYIGDLDPELPLPVIDPVFTNATLTTGETWIILTCRSGTQYVWSDRPLPDPPSYYLGWKEPRVITWGKIRRALSGFDGQYESTNFTVMLSDTDRLLRQLHLDNELVHATAAVYMIDDGGRRALLTPYTVYRGVVTQANPKPTLQFELVIKDTFAEQFSATDSSSLIPRRKFTGEDFANCGVEKVACSADQYLVNGAIVMGSATGYTADGNAATGAGTMAIGNGQGTFAVGQKFCFMSGSTVHTVTSSSGTDPETSVSFTPVLVADVLDRAVLVSGDTVAFLDGGVGIFPPGTRFTFSGHATVYDVAASIVDEDGLPIDPAPAVVFSKSLTSNVADNESVTALAVHAVQPASGKRVPFAYGYISDRNVIGGIDAGDGQGPVRYVGDKVLPDGKRYGEFVWVGHACYSPDGKPFDMVYCWNDALDDMAVGFTNLRTLTEEAGAGGRIVIPGYANWITTNGYGSTTYRDYNGHRITPLYLRGIYRDWALGILAAPTNLEGGIPFAVSGYGADTNGDGTGTLISRGLMQFKHILKNWCPPQGDGYQTGAWLSSPTFADDPTLPMIDEDSFDIADEQSEVYVSGGFGGDFIVGLDDNGLTPRDLIADCARSWGVDVGFSRKNQFFVTLLNTSLSTTTLQPELVWTRDIFSGTWSIDAVVRQLYTAIDYRHTEDYFKRVSAGWRSVTSGETNVENETATARFATTGSPSFSPTYYMPMLRGKNRSADPDYYQRGSDTAAAVLALKLARYSAVQNLPKLLTGPAGFTYALADLFPVTHYEGLGSTGYTQQPIRVERHEIDPSQFTTSMECYDVEPIVA